MTPTSAGSNPAPLRRDFVPWSWFVRRPTPNITLVPTWAPPLVVLDLVGPLHPAEWTRSGLVPLLRELKQERVQVVLRGGTDLPEMRRQVDRAVGGGVDWHAERGWSVAPSGPGRAPGRLRDGSQCVAVVAPQHALEWRPTFPDAVIPFEELAASRGPAAWSRPGRDPVRSWLSDLGYRITGAELHAAAVAVRSVASQSVVRWVNGAEERCQLEWERIERAITFGRVPARHPLMRELAVADPSVWTASRGRITRLFSSNPRLDSASVVEWVQRTVLARDFDAARALFCHPRHDARSWGALVGGDCTPAIDVLLPQLPALVAGHRRWRRRMIAASEFAEASGGDPDAVVGSFIMRTNMERLAAKAPELLVLLAAHSTDAMVFLCDLPDEALPRVPFPQLDRLLGARSAQVRRVGIELARRRAS